MRPLDLRNISATIPGQQQAQSPPAHFVCLLPKTPTDCLSLPTPYSWTCPTLHQRPLLRTNSSMQRQPSRQGLQQAAQSGSQQQLQQQGPPSPSGRDDYVYFQRSTTGFSKDAVPKATGAKLKLEHYYKVAVESAIERNKRYVFHMGFPHIDRLANISPAHRFSFQTRRIGGQAGRRCVDAG